MNFPIITKKDKPFYPTKKICPICGTNRQKLNSNFFVLNGGGLKKIDKQTFVPSKDLIGFLSLTYHSKNSNLNVMVEIIDNSKSGQFDIYFCSTNCIRIFFNEIIDKLDAKLKSNGK